jgi:hypothetical protein
MPRYFLAAALSALVLGCHARFVDLREPGAGSPDQGQGPGPGGPLDLAGLGDAGDGGATPTGKVVARGTFEGRAGHGGDGSAELYRSPDGRIEIRLGSDFRTSAVPGPKVILTSREDMGNRIDPQLDIEVAPLASANGPQTYPVSGGDTGRRNVFIYCKPFSVEVAKAALKDVP